MKINGTGGLDQYQSYIKSLKNGDSQAGGQAAARAGGAKTDTVSISGGAAAKAEISRMAAAMSAEVEQVPAARLEALRTAVAAGEYYVQTKDLADAILDVKI